jgi:inorganic pyrophosphatase
VHPETQAKGDKDPLDVVEIGEEVGFVGQIKEVKVLGVLAMIDEGETDWKVLVIDVRDPAAASLNDLPDVERLRPGLLAKIHEWFRDYKIPDGKPANKFAFDGKFQPRAYALKILEENHALWEKGHGSKARHNHTHAH